MTINAFHPAYIQTHMPEFAKTFRKESALVESGKYHATKASRQSVRSGSRSITSFPKTKAAK